MDQILIVILGVFLGISLVANFLLYVAYDCAEEQYRMTKGTLTEVLAERRKLMLKHDKISRFLKNEGEL